jgi:uncharacterized membrane protein YhhN
MSERGSKRERNRAGGAAVLAYLAGATLIAALIWTVVIEHDPDQWLVGAVLCIALGGSAGHVADGWVKRYVQARLDDLDAEER